MNSHRSVKIHIDRRPQWGPARLSVHKGVLCVEGLSGMTGMDPSCGFHQRPYWVLHWGGGAVSSQDNLLPFVGAGTRTALRYWTFEPTTGCEEGADMMMEASRASQGVAADDAWRMCFLPHALSSSSREAKQTVHIKNFKGDLLCLRLRTL